MVTKFNIELTEIEVGTLLLALQRTNDREDADADHLCNEGLNELAGILRKQCDQRDRLIKRLRQLVY